MELRQTKACNKVQRIDNEETLKHHSHSNKPISLSIFFSQKLFPLGKGFRAHPDYMLATDNNGNNYCMYLHK